MTRLPLLFVAFAVLLLPLHASADETPETPNPTKIPVLDPQDFELLPLTNVEKLAFVAEHPQVGQRAQVLANRAKRLRQQLAKRKNKQDAGSKKIFQQIARLKDQAADVTSKLYDLLADKGFTMEVAEAINACPRGADRMGRYARSLVLVVPELEPKQRALMATVIERMLGARQALRAQETRFRLLAKQSELDADVRQQLTNGFQRQWRENEQRFWRLVDYVLTDDQRAKLGRSLPGPYREKSNGIEHLYRLPGLTPEQFARVQAILTEAEAETSADKAAQRRIREALRAKDLADDERKELRKQVAAAGKRLSELYLDTARQTKAVLTAEQIQAWEAIPPRLSANDRRERSDRVLQGMPLGPRQRQAIKSKRAAFTEQVRELQNKRREVARMGADYGADSPQQMMMQTMMAGVEAAGAALGRQLLGDVFLNVLTVDQTTAWVLGNFGRRK